MAASAESTPPLTPERTRSPSPRPPVQPDHFYSPDNDVHSSPQSPESPGHSWLSPDSDPLAARGIPVFKPTMEEFRDFEDYMLRAEPWGMRSGIVKVIPPKEWTDSLPSILPQLANLRINSPIEQHMLGHAGVFRQQNIVKRKAVSLREWAELCAKEDYRAPAIDEVGLKAAGGHAPHVKKKNKRRTAAAVRDHEPSVRNEAEALLEDTQAVQDVATPLPVAVDSDADIGNNEQHIHDADISSQGTSPRKRRALTREEREDRAATRAELDAAFLETFDPNTAWLPRNTSASDYTPSFCSTLERRYWRNCGLGKPAWYGADTPGTLFTDETKVWNVGSLPSALSRILPKNMAGLPGVNTPYLYFGMWRATFSWHVEDMDLFSINYIHFGAPKFWYAVPQMRAMQLENTLRSFFPRDGEKCRQFLRHKSFFASPTMLAQSGCKPSTLVQHAGEFVITYPRGYHAGFNLGLNCAESVNFALDSWLDIGRKAQVCGCVGDSVRIDVDALLRAREGEERQEEESRESPMTPVELSSKSKKANTKNANPEKAKSPRKRKSDGSGSPRVKKQKTDSEMAGGNDGAVSSSSLVPNLKRKVFLKLPKGPESYPCCLCVSRNTEGLLHVHTPPGPWSGCQNVRQKDSSRNEFWQAHEKCAMLVPETWVDEETNQNGQMEKIVFGVDAIVKDRWALKCRLCQDAWSRRHGAPIQCTKGKCPKAFHISCAQEAGQESRVQFSELHEVEKEVLSSDPPMTSEPPVDATSETDALHDSLEVAQFKDDIDPDSGSSSPPSAGSAVVESSVISSDKAMPNVIKTIKKIEYELLCTQHNPEVMAEKRANKLDRARNDLLALPAMSRIKLRVSAGVFEVSLLSVNEQRNTVEVIWDNGIRKEFKWSSIVWGKAEGQTVGQKPSVAAPVLPGERHPTDLPFVPPRNTPTSCTATPSGNSKPVISSATLLQPAYPGYVGYNSAQLSYSGWPNISYAPSAAGVSPFPSTSSAGASGIRDSYTHYRYNAVYHPPMASSSCTNAVQDQEGALGGPLSPALRQIVESSVAALPPKSQLSGDRHPSSSAPTKDKDQPGGVLGDSTSSNANLTVASSQTSNGAASSASYAQPSEHGNLMPPDVALAIEELRRLSSLDPERLTDLLGSRPALREAVGVLVAHQMAQAQLQLPSGISAQAP